jgi:hypothetical protein
MQGPEEDVAEREDHATEATIAPNQVRGRQSNVIPGDEKVLRREKPGLFVERVSTRVLRPEPISCPQRRDYRDTPDEPKLRTDHHALPTR